MAADAPRDHHRLGLLRPCRTARDLGEDIPETAPAIRSSCRVLDGVVDEMDQGELTGTDGGGHVPDDYRERVLVDLVPQDGCHVLGQFDGPLPARRVPGAGLQLVRFRWRTPVPGRLR